MSKVFVTGDTHGNFERIEYFCSEHNTTKDDYMIILGDAGINYYGGKRDRELKKYLNKMSISFFCIHGNHEMRPASVGTYRIGTMLGAGYCDPFYIEDEFPNILFGMDGGVYGFNGKKCLVIGGAYSVDKYYRLARGWGWWPDEQPDDDTKAFVESKLAKLDNSVDIILSHTCPAKYIPTEMFLPSIDQSTVDSSTEEWLDRIEDSVKYGRWLCGHYHTDKRIDKVHFMFNDIMLLADA